MSNVFRHLLSAEQVVSTLRRALPEDEAMALAVGGDDERFGLLEHAVLRDGEQGAVIVGPGEATAAVPTRPQAIGQSIWVLRKPLAGVVPTPRRPGTATEDARDASERRAWRRAERAAGTPWRNDRGGDAAKAVSPGGDAKAGTEAPPRLAGQSPGRPRRRQAAMPRPKAADR